MGFYGLLCLPRGLAEIPVVANDRGRTCSCNAVKHLVELSAADLKTLRTMKPMSQQNREDEAKLPRQGILLVVGIVAGIFALIGLVDCVWKLIH